MAELLIGIGFGVGALVTLGVVFGLLPKDPINDRIAQRIEVMRDRDRWLTAEFRKAMAELDQCRDTIEAHERTIEQLEQQIIYLRTMDAGEGEHDY